MSARNYHSTDTSHTDAADVPLFGDQQPRVSKRQSLKVCEV